MTGRVLPTDRSALVAAYLDGCSASELRLQRCDSCGAWQFYPRPFCTHCGSGDLSWRTASGLGRIATFSTVYRSIGPAYEAPYTIALIDLAEGPRMMSIIVGADPDTLAVGDPVSVAFETWAEDVSLPVFHVTSQGVDQ